MGFYDRFREPDEWLTCPVCKGEYCNKSTCPECKVDLVSIDELPDEDEEDDDDRS